MNVPAGTVTMTINVLPTFEERVVDWLLDHEAIAGFTSHAAHGHGSSHDGLSVAEQVSGRQRRTEFRVELPAAALDGLLASLAQNFADTDLYYYVTPVLRSGHLRRTVK